MTDHSDLKGDLEYNDGLGDLLREKERLEFSWVKTIVSLVVILGAVYLGVNFLFKFSKSIIEDSVEVKYSEETLQTEVKEIPVITPAPIPEAAPKLTKVITKPESKKTTKKATPSGNAHKVIVGSFVSKANAQSLKKTLEKKGFSAFVWSTKQGSERLYRVQSGAYATRQMAQGQKEALSKKGFDSYILKK